MKNEKPSHNQPPSPPAIHQNIFFKKESLNTCCNDTHQFVLNLTKASFLGSLNLLKYTVTVSVRL